MRVRKVSIAKVRRKTRSLRCAMQFGLIRSSPSLLLASATCLSRLVVVSKVTRHTLRLLPPTSSGRRLSRRELDRIRGIYASDSWDYQAAEAAFHDYTVYYEHDYAGVVLPRIAAYSIGSA